MLNSIVILTTALVGVTVYYATQTKKSVDAIKESTKIQFMPYIKGTIFNIGPSSIVLRLQNIGKGPARDAKIQTKEDFKQKKKHQ